jgi:hypothetical protein
MSSILPFSVDDYFRTTGIGSLDKAISRNLYGLNHRQTPAGVLGNRDVYGYTFFTRPQLNMQGNNLRNDRLFYDLLTLEEDSLQRYVRCTLDPRMQYGYSSSNKGKVEKLKCPLVDPMQAFIPGFTNSLLSVSGWPDLVAPTYSSKPGLYKEEYSQIDGTTKIYNAFDLDVTFRNFRGDPILYMLYIWIRYSSLVFEGILVPYPDFILENELDYCTRIYRLVMDHTKTFVKKIAATGISFPTAVPMGGYFDYNSEDPFNEQMREVTIRFTSLGAEYADTILVREFNQTVQIFNPHMRDNHIKTSMVKVPYNYLTLFNNSGYPRIDGFTYELEWYVPAALYNAKVAALNLVTKYPFTAEDVNILANKPFGV